MNPAQVSDISLIIRIQSGEKDAMQIFIKRWNLYLYNRISYLTNNPEVAKDLLQECWSSILKSIVNLKEPEKFKAWMLTIANRKAYDWIRKIKGRQTVSLESIKESEIYESENYEASQEEKIQLLRETIRELDRTQRIILNLFYLENLSINQISKQLDIPKGTAKSRLFYGRELLKKRIKEGVIS